MAKVSYNGINLPYPLHSNFSMESVYDESGTDRIYTKIAATVQCLVNTDYASSCGLTLDSTSNVVQMMRMMRNKLMQPRKRLSVWVGNRDLVPNRAMVPGDVDAKNGPQVKSCVISQFDDYSFLVSFSVEGNYWENFTNDRAAELDINKPGNTVLSCRWSDSIEMDQSMYSRRIREGTYVIRSDNAGGLTVDGVRESFAMFGLVAGFQRTRANYRVHPDGLKMSFTLEDVEKYFMPPKPAYEADGTYTESTTNNGAHRWAECNVRLRAPKDASKVELIRTALTVMMTKLRQANSVINTASRDGQNFTLFRVQPFNILSSSVIRTQLYDNSCEVSARFMMSPNGRTVINGVSTIDWRTIAYSPAGSPPNSPPPAYYARGTAGLVLRAAAYFDPSLANLSILQTQGNLGPGLTRVGQAGVEKEG